jgi:Zn-finger protein
MSPFYPFYQIEEGAHYSWVVDAAGTKTTKIPHSTKSKHTAKEIAEKILGAAKRSR